MALRVAARGSWIVDRTIASRRGMVTSMAKPNKMPVKADEVSMQVGVRTGVLHDASRSHWDEAAPRPVSRAAWYPADDEAAAADLVGCGPTAPLFRVGAVAEGAPVRAAGVPWPIVLMSHGTGGIASRDAVAGHRLARRGFVALAPNHHGNTWRTAMSRAY